MVKVHSTNGFVDDHPCLQPTSLPIPLPAREPANLGLGSHVWLRVLQVSPWRECVIRSDNFLIALGEHWVNAYQRQRHVWLAIVPRVDSLL